MDKCNHTWHYVHAVYQNDSGSTMVRRWCSVCKAEQVGIVARWRKPKPDEFDQTAEETAEND